MGGRCFAFQGSGNRFAGSRDFAGHRCRGGEPDITGARGLIVIFSLSLSLLGGMFGGLRNAWTRTHETGKMIL